MPLTPSQARRHVPLASKVTYLDSAATSLAPRPVLEAMGEYYDEFGVNVERGSYALSRRATDVFEAAREDTGRLLLNCPPEELVFTRNMTEGANIVAYALGHPRSRRSGTRLVAGPPIMRWRRGDEVLGTVLDHHSNILPWQRLALEVGARYRQVDAPVRGLVAADLTSVSRRTRLVVLQHVGNVTGAINDVRGMTRFVKSRNPECLVFVDGSQAPGHMEVDVKSIDCDFYAFSGHKGPMGPKGTGGLYAVAKTLEKMEPLLLGGGIIRDVTATTHRLRGDMASRRFDAGTPNIPGLIGLGRAARYVVKDIGLDRISAHGKQLTSRLTAGLSEIEGLTLYGDGADHAGLASFNVDGYTCQEVASVLDGSGICVRAGHHCALPLARKLGALRKFGGEVRASTHYYNSRADIDRLLDVLATLSKA
ncbi:MAG: cysteine desulfurase [Euryarchaeota archaeon]|nr:cysteine desulfurase [Euryarchaeota archaeon]